MLPEYQCHKKVRAAKIDAIINCPGPVSIGGKCIIRAGDMAIGTSWDWVRRHDANVGGYYVEYDDGYKSYSPAAAFESGYSRCDIPPVPTPTIGARRSEPAYAGPNSIHRDATWIGISHVEWPVTAHVHGTACTTFYGTRDNPERRKSQRRVDVTGDEFVKRRTYGPRRRSGLDRRRA